MSFSLATEDSRPGDGIYTALSGSLSQPAPSKLSRPDLWQSPVLSHNEPKPASYYVLSARDVKTVAAQTFNCIHSQSFGYYEQNSCVNSLSILFYSSQAVYLKCYYVTVLSSDISIEEYRESSR